MKNIDFILTTDGCVVKTINLDEIKVYPYADGETIIVKNLFKKSVDNINGMILKDSDGVIIASRVFLTGTTSYPRGGELEMYWNLTVKESY